LCKYNIHKQVTAECTMVGFGGPEDVPSSSVLTRNFLINRRNVKLKQVLKHWNALYVLDFWILVFLRHAVMTVL